MGAIDDAFRSRLHLTLYYPKLTRGQTKKIWKNNIDRIETISEERRGQGQLPIVYDEKAIMKWMKLNWEVLQLNGRQIRNAFQTALALAEFDAKHSASKGKRSSSSSPKEAVLEVSHFRLIADAMLQFSEYLLAVHGADEEDIAVREKMRPAGFTPKPKPLKDVLSSSSSSSSDDSSDTDSDDEETEDESGTKKGKKDKKKAKKQKQKEKEKEKGKRKRKRKGKKEAKEEEEL